MPEKDVHLGALLYPQYRLLWDMMERVERNYQFTRAKRQINTCVSDDGTEN